MSTKPRWTHTATITAAVPVGAEQFGEHTQPGDTVTLWQDPADQEGAYITFRKGNGTGAVHLAYLTNVTPKEA